MGLLGKLFGSEKKDYSYQGPRPLATSTNSPGGKEYYDILKQRLAGQGLGFGNDYASKYSSPIVNNMRSQFEGYQLPALKDELSATGRRRSSTGFDQVRRAYQEQGLNEGDVFSRLQQRNEDQSRSELNAALEGAGRLGQSEAGMVNNLANFEYANNEAQVNRDINRQAKQAQGYQNLIAAGSDLISGMGGGFGGGGMVSTAASGLNYGGRNYGITPPPANYDYSNIASRYASKSGQRGRIV